MSSRSPANVNFSFEEFSRHGGGTGPHRDGWGVAYYADRDVRLIREPEAASDSDCVRFIEEHDLRSRLVISHVRHATRGERRLENTQPFARELGGRMHVFAHNGDVGSDLRFRLGCARPIGSTDSEHAFCSLLARIQDLWASGVLPELAERFAVIAAFAAELSALGPANFLYSDGDCLFAHADRRRQPGRGGFHPPGLHTLRRTCSCEPSIETGSGVRIHTPDSPASQEVLLVATVPLTGEPWLPLSEGTLLAIRGGRVEESMLRSSRRGQPDPPASAAPVQTMRLT